MKVFINEDALLAIADKKRSTHIAMTDEFQMFLQGGHRFYTTNVVVGNVLSEIKKDQGTARAEKFYSILEEAWLGTYLHILWIGRRTFKDAVRLFKKFPDSTLSLYDCANVVLMNRRNIRFILTINSAYDKMGFKTVPEVEG